MGENGFLKAVQPRPPAIPRPLPPARSAFGAIAPPMAVPVAALSPRAAPLRVGKGKCMVSIDSLGYPIDPPSASHALPGHVHFLIGWVSGKIYRTLSSKQV